MSRLATIDMFAPTTTTEPSPHPAAWSLPLIDALRGIVPPGLVVAMQRTCGDAALSSCGMAGNSRSGCSRRWPRLRTRTLGTAGCGALGARCQRAFRNERTHRLGLRRQRAGSAAMPSRDVRTFLQPRTATRGQLLHDADSRFDTTSSSRAAEIDEPATACARTQHRSSCTRIEAPRPTSGFWRQSSAVAACGRLDTPRSCRASCRSIDSCTSSSRTVAGGVVRAQHEAAVRRIVRTAS